MHLMPRKKSTKLPRPLAKKVAKAPTKKHSGPGRPKGPSRKVEGWDVSHVVPFSRKNSAEPKPGVRRIIVEIADEKRAILLERLALMLVQEDPKLMRAIKPPKAD